ncbi:DUF998 domain-containing protein [Nocardia otitidiscaviarum]|uniref:DUF998 domain-containing protein n=1 Tax=Nocardia otitidiscaviarum TaxID=1823 RepID=A0A516NVE0_9NOCA|nr:DUF998 domain-containing protein [Nocardia otitidiscaviarum]MCP9622346.1 DUF998 domain-containing protein [Nocardia otitidiscaviarum]QDP82880.1 DUF998 domain-containing protein [Nocardia otitidiscaviarum]
MKTEKLLTAGALATPVFFAIALAQAFTRDGFDLSRHMISQLALGDLGWLQIANFVGTGVLFVLGALGLRRALTDGIGHTWIPRLVAVFGAGLIAAGVFVCDPVKGYPVGEPDTLTWHGMAHGAAATISGFALVAANIILTRRYLRADRKAMAAITIAITLAFMVLPAALPSQVSMVFAAVSFLAWGWISLLAASLLPTRRTAGATREPQFA